MPKALHVLDKEIWCLNQGFRLKGLEIGTRSTLIRLTDGSLWLHSPGPEIGAAYRSICRLGEVRQIIAPNAFHHLYLEQAQQLFPQARCWGPGAVAQKHPKLALLRLQTAAPSAWSEELAQQALTGLISQEYAFYHRASRTLILTDLLMHLFPKDHLSRVLLGIGGFNQRLTGGPLVSKVWLRNRSALRQSLQNLLNWPFERIVLAHGRIVEVDAHARFEAAFAWLLHPRTT